MTLKEGIVNTAKKVVEGVESIAAEVFPEEPAEVMQMIQGKYWIDPEGIPRINDTALIELLKHFEDREIIIQAGEPEKPAV